MKLNADMEYDLGTYMAIAVAQAVGGITQGHGGPFGAVIVNSNTGKVVGVGHNRVVVDNDPTAHGEMEAIRHACANLNTFDLSGHFIVTTGEPCPMCACAIRWANLDGVVYGCTLKDNEDIGFRDNVFDTTSTRNEYIQSNRNMCLNLFEKYKNIKHCKY